MTKRNRKIIAIERVKAMLTVGNVVDATENYNEEVVEKTWKTVREVDRFLSKMKERIENEDK